MRAAGTTEAPTNRPTTTGSDTPPARSGPAGASPAALRRRHRRWPAVLAAALLLALAAGGVWVAYRTSVLGLRQVDVAASAGELSPALRTEVEAAVDVQDGTPLVTLDLAAVRRRVLDVPGVASASVSRHWPHDLAVTVVQRTPVAVTRANGSLWLLDATGLPYQQVAPAQVPTGLLTVQLATPGVADPSTSAALTVLRQLRAPVRGLVSTVAARSPYAVTLLLADGRTVLWGSVDQGDRKMQILPAVLAQPGRSIDISDPALVTVRGN